MNNSAKKTIGQQIAEARKAKGWTLEEAARRTNLKPSLLAHIEADEFDKLPGISNARGFIRLYARELELDGWSLLKQFNGIADVPVDMLELEPADLESIPTRSREPIATSQGIGFFLVIAVILVALGVGGYKLYTVGPFIKKNTTSAPIPVTQAPPEPVTTHKPETAQPVKPVKNDIPVAKPVTNTPPKAQPVNALAPATPINENNPPKAQPAEPVQTQTPAPTPTPAPAATKGLRLQLIADSGADDQSRWVRVIAIRNGKEESIYADTLPPGKAFPIDEPWVADSFIISMREASSVGIIQNGGSPQKYELPGFQRIKLPVN